MSIDFKDVGNPIQLNASADPGGRITSKLRNYMNKIDLIPIKFKMKIPTSAFSSSDENLSESAITYDFDTAISKYKENLAQYVTKNSYSGVRIWTTSDAQYQEDISNTFETNVLEDKMNSVIASGTGIRDWAKAFGVDPSAISKFLTDNINNATDTNANATESAASAIIEGKHMSLPKVWKNSAYAPTLNLNVRLVSPYGNSKSIRIHVVEPLIYLLGLCSPTSVDGISYGNVGYVRVNAYGLSNINLGYIENISIVRGGSDMTFNQYSQPLFADLNITIRSAFDGFALVKNEGINVSTIDNTSMVIQDGNVKSGIASVGSLIKSFQRRNPGTITSNSSIPNIAIDILDKLADVSKGTSAVTSSLEKLISDFITPKF